MNVHEDGQNEAEESYFIVERTGVTLHFLGPSGLCCKAVSSGALVSTQSQSEGGECKVMLTYRHASQNYDK